MTRRTDKRTARLPVPAGELPQFTPVPRQTNRHDGWTPERQHQFIEALADTGSVDAACRAVDMSQPGAYYLRRQPGADSFRAAWEKALQLGVQRIEDVAMDRALNGVEVPVYSYGRLVGTRRTYNDRLLMFMLRNRAAGRFAEGSAKGMNAVDQMQVERLKKQWLKEYEAKQAGQTRSPAEVRASIDRKIDGLRIEAEERRQREWESLSEETREAWERFERLKERDLSRAQVGGSEAGQRPTRSADKDATPPGELRNATPRRRIAKQEPEDGPVVRKIKDEGWD